MSTERWQRKVVLLCVEAKEVWLWEAFTKFMEAGFLFSE